jgi:hypothetical protein
MLKMFQSLSQWEQLWRKQNVVLFSVIWCILSLVVYIFFSGPMQGAERPLWYRIVTAYVLQNIPIVAASLLCLRNGLSRRMPSGSEVWLLMGIALFSYFLGNIFFVSWELIWGLNPTGSLGDFFFTIFYLLLAIAMLLAVISKRINLKSYQWLIIGSIATYASMMVIWILTPPVAASNVLTELSNTQIPTTFIAQAASSGTESYSPDIPGWVQAADQFFKPHGNTLNLVYVWSDVGLFCLAAVMIIGFWGGKLSNAWQVNAQAIICLYIADMWFAYAGKHIENYQTGFFLEVFWILGSIQFGIAAAMEFHHMLVRQRQQVQS